MGDPQVLQGGGPSTQPYWPPSPVAGSSRAVSPLRQRIRAARSVGAGSGSTGEGHAANAQGGAHHPDFRSWSGGDADADSAVSGGTAAVAGGLLPRRSAATDSFWDGRRCFHRSPSWQVLFRQYLVPAHVDTHTHHARACASACALGYAACKCGRPRRRTDMK